jgi:hypothetical protein
VETIIDCPCGVHGCKAVLRDGNVYAEGFNFDRRADTDPERLLDYGRAMGKFVPTNDDWAPSFPGGFVAVAVRPVLTVRGGDPQRWRVTVCGGDDSGLERFFDSESGARHAYERLPSYIAMSDLIALGFKHW